MTEDLWHGMYGPRLAWTEQARPLAKRGDRDRERVRVLQVMRGGQFGYQETDVRVTRAGRRAETVLRWIGGTIDPTTGTMQLDAHHTRVPLSVVVEIQAMMARMAELTGGVRRNPRVRTAPAAVRAAARRALALYAAGHRCCTPVGLARARQLAGGHEVTDRDIKHMAAYFARHAVDRRPGWDTRVTRGYLSWMMWGGDAGAKWAARERARIDGRSVRR